MENMWTPDEIQYVRERGVFAIAINFEEKDVKPYLYQYDRILDQILGLADDVIEFHDKAYETFSLVRFTPAHRFLLVSKNKVCDVKELGQFDTEEEAIGFLNRDKIKDSIAIVDISKLSPWFIGMGCLVYRATCGEEVATFSYK